MHTRVHPPSPARLRLLAAALRRGDLVAIPTETVYGLAAHALDPRACRAIFRAKRRPADDPLIVHVDRLSSAEALADFNPAARALANAFWPGPLTLVLPKKPIVPAIVTSGQDSVALRSPAHPLARRLLKLAGVPLAAPSANPFGYVSPTTADHVLQGLAGRIPHVLDGGPCRVGVESTIVDVRDPARLRILRPGAISARAMLAALRAAGIREARFPRTPAARRLLAPGTLEQHYSPATPLSLVPRLGAADRTAAAAEAGALIFWRRSAGAQRPGEFWLTTRGAADEAAQRLYAVLRQVDAGDFAWARAERPPARAGTAGEAVADRLTRAAAKRRA